MLVCALSGLLSLIHVGIYAQFDNIRQVDVWLGLCAAPFIGIGVTLLVRIIQWVEQRYSTDKSLSATYLMVLVIFVNITTHGLR